MLKLPDVTLVVAETRAHDLARRTINDLVSRVEFGGIIIYSDDCWRIDVPGAEYVKVADWPDKRTSGLFYYTEAATRIKTSHALLIEWDAGLNDPAMWDARFLDYDYIGAPWPSQPPLKDVGNGGFMLLSKRLIDFLAVNRRRFPITTDMDISVKWRPQIEAEGNFKWPDAKLAEQFSFEGWQGIPRLAERPKSFGYHGLFHWQWMLDPAERATREQLVLTNPFMQKSGKVKLLMRARQAIGEPIAAQPRSRGYTPVVHPNFYLHQRQRAEAQRQFLIAQQRGLKA